MLISFHLQAGQQNKGMYLMNDEINSLRLSNAYMRR